MAREDSNEASLHYYRGLGYWGKHKFDQADSALRLAVRESNRFYQRAFMIDPLVSLRIISLVWGVDERGFRDYTSDEARIYQLYFEGFVDLSMSRYGLAFERFGRLARSVYDEDKHPEKVPSFLRWHRGLAAAHSLKEAAANDLGLYMAHVYLAEIYEQQKRWPEALTERRRAVEANPDDFSLELDVGMLPFNLEQTKDAEEPIEKAVAMNPRAALGHYLLGRIGEELGRPAGAKAHLTQFVALAPHRLDDLVSDAKQRLAKLP